MSSIKSSAEGYTSVAGETEHIKIQASYEASKNFRLVFPALPLLIPSGTAPPKKLGSSNKAMFLTRSQCLPPLMCTFQRFVV
ncbi:hypothetical protein UPYG_G00317350 [Umbra pygmaea]|uniref:Uncharacterized protein n=1 Tax=Umbra pygmaea TaxID=75934 RepID=A0ABD0WF35_UMBPY